MIGVTGTGKSSTGNNLMQQEHFKASDSAESETSETKGKLGSWVVDSEHYPIIVLDTPGIGDSSNRDTSHIANMVIRLKAIGYVHCFLITLNSENPRLDLQLQETLKLFKEMFGEDFFKNVIICFTKFKQDKRSTSSRVSGKMKSKNLFITEHISKFQELFNVEITKY